MTSAAVQTAIYALGMDSLDYVRGVDAKVAADAKAIKSSEGVEVQQEKVTRATRTTADAMEKLLARLDPRIRAEQQLQKVMDQVNRARNEGVGASTQYTRAIELAQQKVDRFTAANDNSAKALQAFHGGLNTARNVLAAFGVSLGIAAVVQFGKSVFNATADLQEQADQVLGAGGNVEALQALRGTFLQNGIAAEAGDKILARLTRTLGEAADGSDKAQGAFKKLGLGAKELAGTSADAALPLIAKRLLEIEDASARAKIETDLFGKSGQQLESALAALASGSINDLIKRAKELGIVIDEQMIKKADEAKDKMELSWMKLQTAMAPIVVEWVNAFSQMTEGVGGTTSQLEKLIDKIKVFAAVAAGARIGSLVGGLPGAVVGGAAAGLAAYGATNTPFDDTTTAELEAKLRSPTLTEAGRAYIQQQINARVPYRGLVTQAARNMDTEAVTVSATRDGGAPGWKPTKEDVANAQKLKQTFDSYLVTQQESARLATLTTQQRTAEQSVIAAAQIAQKEADADHQVAEAELIRTYAEAAQYLGEVRTQKVLTVEAAKAAAPLEREINNQIKLGEVALTSSVHQRELALEIAQQELVLGRDLTQVEKDRLKVKQQQNDAARLNDYMQNMREEVSLAGMSADERERHHAVLQAMRMTHGELTAGQAAEIDNLVKARQETERWREMTDQLVSGLTSGFQNFFMDVFNKGKDAFSGLWNTIKQMFFQMLAAMATQALVQPIIVPIVTQMMGGFATMGMSGGGGAMGALSGIGQIGQMSSFGGGNFLGLSAGPGGMFGGQGLINGLGGMLGFATPTSAASIASSSAGLSGAMGGISTTSIPAMQSGSLFGSLSLGSFAGGVGLGMLGSSLLFGNKNDASLGSMGGAAAGALAGTFLFPGVGTVLGGLIGGLAGGGLGSMTGSSNQGAISNFTNGGLGNTLFKQGGGNNGQMATSASAAVNEAIRTLQSAGANVSLGNITGLSIGSDKSYIYDSMGGKQKLAGGDVEGVVAGVLERILPSISGATSEAQAVIAKYQANGGVNAGNLQQLMTDLGSAKNFSESLKNLKQADEVLSDFGQRLQAINQQYDQLATTAQELGQDISGLTDARTGAIRNLFEGYLQNLEAMGAAVNDSGGAWAQRADAIALAEENAAEAAGALGEGLDRVSAAAARARGAMAEDFNKAVSDAILQITDPIQLKYNQMLEMQAQRMNEAAAAGADLNKVLHLNTLEMESADREIAAQKAAAEAQKAAEAQAAAAEAARQAALAQQAALDAAADAAAQALQQSAALQKLSDFNRDIAIQILRFVNPAQAEYQQLLVTQADRVRQAILAGADLNEVYRLNNLELTQLSNQPFLKGLTEEITGLSRSAQEAADAANRTAQDWGNAEDALRRARKAILVSDPTLSPRDRYTNTRTQLDELLAKARTGDAAAATDFASFSSQFLQASVAFSASGSAYQDDRTYVINALGELERFSVDRADVAERQAASAEAAIPLLQAILDGIQAQTTENKKSNDQMKAEVNSLKREIQAYAIQQRLAG